MPQKFDFEEVVKQFHRHGFPEQAVMMRELIPMMEGSPALARIMANLTDELIKHNATPAQCMKTFMRYGLVIGILMERERAARERRTN
jgi:hypothetical protein